MLHTPIVRFCGKRGLQRSPRGSPGRAPAPGQNNMDATTLPGPANRAGGVGPAARGGLPGVPGGGRRLGTARAPGEVRCPRRATAPDRPGTARCPGGSALTSTQGQVVVASGKKGDREDAMSRRQTRRRGGRTKGTHRHRATGGTPVRWRSPALLRVSLRGFAPSTPGPRLASMSTGVQRARSPRPAPANLAAATDGRSAVPIRPRPGNNSPWSILNDGKQRETWGENPVAHRQM